MSRETNTPEGPASPFTLPPAASATSPLRSHEYQFTLREFCRATLPTLMVLGALIAILLAGRRWSWLPTPAPGANSDRTVLAHQLRASRGESPASVLVVGDSTCLQGVDAAELARHLGNDSPVLSLALFIWIDLDGYGRLVSDFAVTHPDQLRAVVLLVSPPKLTGLGQTAGAAEFWRQDQLMENQRQSQDHWIEPEDLFGVRQFRQGCLCRLVATPLRGSGAAVFGFNSGIDAYMSAHNGSLVSCETVTPRKPKPPAAKSDSAPANAEWAFGEGVEADSLAFRRHIPPGIKLFAGFTPSMAGIVSPEESRLRQALMRRWNQSIRADVLLTNLPTSLPDVFYSSGNHLNAAGQRVFTRILANQLRPFVQQRKAQP